MNKPEEPTILFGNSKWIWAEDATKKNSNVILRRTFSFGTDKPPARAFCRAACNTHYYLFVNGNAAVWCGGMNRGASVYYDEFDIAKFLVKGDNVIVAYCQYFGNDGRDMVSTERAGFIFECNDLKIYSDRGFTAYEDRAYKKPRADNCYYAGRSIDYDASLEGQIQNVLDPAFNSSLFLPATELDGYPDDVSGVVIKRPIPLEKFSAQPIISRFKKTTDQFAGDTYTITLPREMRVTPYMEVTGNGQEKISIYTDRSDCFGTFGDDESVYHAHTIEYMTKPTVNIFEGLLPMTGRTLMFSCPKTVKVIKLGYREIGYNAAPTVSFETGDKRIDALFDKATETLYMCMGSTLMDTPERERSMWLGDASIAARALYLSYHDAGALVKKVIDDVLEFADGDVLYSCVPGSVPVDMPSHGLMALSERGIFAQYRNFAGDVEFFKREYERLCDYLMLWDMTERGVLIRDGGNNRWYDNLYNVDESLIENALYYSACKFLIDVGRTVSNTEYEETFVDRMDNIADYIESCFDGLGYTTLGNGYDDRANALIVLTGLVPDDRKKTIARLLASTYAASPYLEWAVTEALGILGRNDLAVKRFVSRYALAAESDDTTLGEDFSGYGTKCQSYQTAVVFELISYFGGIEIENGAANITITPDFTAMKDMRVSLKLATGELDVRYKYSPVKTDILIDNKTNAKVTLEIIPERVGGGERRSIVLNKGKNKFGI